jgi:hypothetical protein
MPRVSLAFARNGKQGSNALDPRLRFFSMNVSANLQMMFSPIGEATNHGQKKAA